MIKLLARQGARRSIDRDPGRQVNVQRSIGRCVRQGNAGGRNQAWGAPDEAQARRQYCPPWDATRKVHEPCTRLGSHDALH